LSENILPNQTELGWNGPWMFLFKNYVQQPYPTSKMAVVTKNINFKKWPKHFLSHILVWDRTFFFV
jgi:hypothetical protein